MNKNLECESETRAAEETCRLPSQTAPHLLVELLPNGPCENSDSLHSVSQLVKILVLLPASACVFGDG